eukprot:gene4933-34704_t
MSHSELMDEALDGNPETSMVGEPLGPSIVVHTDSTESGGADRESTKQADLVLSAWMESSGGKLALGLNAASLSFMLKGKSTMPIGCGFTWDKVDSTSASMLELGKLRGNRVLQYIPSRDRQWHMYLATERPDPRMPELRRLFARALLRDLDSPALLAASYSGDPGTAAMAAVSETEDLLGSGGQGADTDNCLLQDLDSPALLAASYIGDPGSTAMAAVCETEDFLALLAASCSGDPGTAAMAAVSESEELLVRCLEELVKLQEGVPTAGPSPSPHGVQRLDYCAHLFFSVLPPLPLQSSQPKDEARIAAGMRSAIAGLVARHIGSIRRAAVAEWEVRFRGSQNGGAWRIVVSLPSGHEHGEEHVHVYRETMQEAEPAGDSPSPVRLYEAQVSSGVGLNQQISPCLIWSYYTGIIV